MADRTDVLGRDRELALIGEFVAGIGQAGQSGGSLIIEGEPGIGKTTLWTVALAQARQRSCTVLTCRCGQREAMLLAIDLEAGLSDARAPAIVLRGDGLRLDLAERATALDSKAGAVRAVDGADLPLGALLKAADRLDEARARLEGVLAAATREQDDSSQFEVALELGHLECLAGRWQLAEHYASQTAEIVEVTGQHELRPAVLVLEALLCSLRGQLDRARTKALDGLATAEQAHSLWFTLMSLPVLGFTELSAGQAAEAVSYLARADDICERIGLREPGRFRFLADYVEALIATGDLNRAQAVLGRLGERGSTLGRRWALATAGRCEMLLVAARGDSDGALAHLERALAHHADLPMPFERARTLLAGGTVHRRARHKKDARDMLNEALACFEALGATVWARQARDGLARIGLRTASPLDLTATERRVAELVATGQTNREIAEALFISLRTVESTLSRVDRKRGVRSRAELVRMAFTESLGPPR